MQATVTYVHHSSFVLEIGNRLFLFDYPEAVHLPAGAADVVGKKIAGKEIFVFVSHGHEDHFHKNLARVVAPAQKARFVVSDDVPDMFPESVPGDALIVEPDESYNFSGLSIETLMANDLGVAFLIETDGIGVYFGGDLAEWIWPEMEETAVRFTETYFQEAIDRVRGRNIHIAFHNVDRRLANLGGGMKFLRQVRPPVFVPMHGFGDTAWYRELDYPCDPDRTRVFRYRRPGDEMRLALDPFL
jgi:L-ascorbate metabolism protein UlaG (beta-lactamase superfamily)